MRHVLFVSMLVALPAAARDDAPSRGELLYANHCTACHESVVHVREARRASSVRQLREQIVRWSTHQSLDWGESEIADVLTYLDTRYYHFGEP